MPTCSTWFVKETGERHPITATFSDVDWVTLLRFSELAGRLRETSFVQSGENFFTILCGDGEITVSSRLPSPDDLAAFLHRLRPFIHKKEPVEFGKVVNIMKQGVRDEAVLGVLNSHRALFNIKSSSELVGIDITTNGREIVSEEMLKAWLYGEEYHFDAEKSAALQVMAATVPPEIWRTLLIRVLICKTNAVFLTSRMIDHLRGRLAKSTEAAQGVGATP